MVQLIEASPVPCYQGADIGNLERFVSIILNLYKGHFFLKEVKYELWFVSFCRPNLELCE